MLCKRVIAVSTKSTLDWLQHYLFLHKLQKPVLDKMCSRTSMSTGEGCCSKTAAAAQRLACCTGSPSAERPAHDRFTKFELLYSRQCTQYAIQAACETTAYKLCRPPAACCLYPSIAGNMQNKSGITSTSARRQLTVQYTVDAVNSQLLCRRACDAH